ncbi:MAG: precorrin-6y C5,15-methyltransferase (decarboxylating) subunit CbiE [Deferribacteraceae bacterium]|jgi:precorrin-6y C5,15-methyltransferase (decarboxylating) CbiE subunit|nr:precorrin-6y C5,15-methyltransferase (decarboxylating) subunit CbiE [Deferribacteraceae bacterium]
MNKLYLISCGPGGADDITIKAFNIIKKCDLLAGSQRLLKTFRQTAPVITLPASSKKAAAILNKRGEEKIGVLLSGDAGFYSQAAGLRQYINEREMITVPGVSVVQYVAAKLNISWQSAELICLHTKDISNGFELPDKDTIILLKDGIDIKTLFLRYPKIIKERDVWIMTALSEPDERLTLWDGNKYICRKLTTVAICEREVHITQPMYPA